MMEEYTDICSLLGLEDIDIKPDGHWVSAGLNDKQTIIEETLCDPSELLEFLVSEQLREDCRTNYSNQLREDCRTNYSNLLSSLNIDINLNINELSDCDRSGPAEPSRHRQEDDRSGVSDLIDSESDSGVESINSLSPQGPSVSPPPSPSDSLNLSLSSIHAMLPVTPLPIRELTESSSLDSGEMVAVPPRLLIKQDKKPSLLSSILSRPPMASPKASKQLSSLLSSSVFPVPAPGNTSHNFSGFDSFKQKDNSRSDSTVRTVPTIQTERENVREIPARKKLIINKRKKEMIHVRESKRLQQDEASNISLPWDGDLRSSMTSCEDSRVRQLPGGGPGVTQTQPTPRSHSRPDKTFTCPTCYASFHSASARSCHRRQVHQRHHLCTTCDRAFSNQQKLERHLKIHRIEAKRMRCEKLGKEPGEKTNAYYNSNSGKKRFECPSCPREYFTKSGLNHHLKQVHSKEMLYKCSQCEFVGKTRLELENHCGEDHRIDHRVDHGIDHTQSIISNQRNQGFRNSLDDMMQTPPSTLDGKDETRPISISKSNQCNHCGRKFAFKNSLTKHLSKGRCVILKRSQHQPISF